MMDYTPKRIVYFKYCGEVNTTAVLQLALERAKEIDIGKLVIASETGRSALKALEIFKGTDIELVVVTHYPATTIGPRGRIPIGLKRPEYTERLKFLLAHGVKLVQGTRPLAPPSRSIKWDDPTPEGMVDKTLELFGAGTKIAIEVSLMATDAGEIEEGEEVISCAGTYKGLDTALVVQATFCMNFFKELEVKEVIAKPRSRVKKLPEYKFENWKGDLEIYYQRTGLLEESG
jgi:hypothetical protein